MNLPTQPEPPTPSGFGAVLGASPAMRRVYPLLERVAASDVPVLLEGETGTGKEAVAEAIHAASARAAGPFAVLDCTAIPPSLVESMLFGHERGAFTGAVSSRVGVFEQAHGGTLFIDEIGDLDPALQPKLLRAIERSSVRPVGARGFTRVDVRILCATRRDLHAEIARGAFRDDLFYRIAVARITLPPLREREGDVRLLAEAFWRRAGGTSEGPPAELLAELERHPFPGNVRELGNLVAQRVALGDLGPESGISERRIPSTSSSTDGAQDPIGALLARDLPYLQAREELLDEFTRRYFGRVLDRHRGNVTRAARDAGLARRYFYTLLEKTGR